MVHCFVVNVELNVVDSRCILRRSLITAASGPMKTGSQNSGKDFNSYSLRSIVSTDSVIGYFGDWLACRLTGLHADWWACRLACRLTTCRLFGLQTDYRLTGLQTDWFADWLACRLTVCILTVLPTGWLWCVYVSGLYWLIEWVIISWLFHWFVNKVTGWVTDRLIGCRSSDRAAEICWFTSPLIDPLFEQHSFLSSEACLAIGAVPLNGCQKLIPFAWHANVCHVQFGTSTTTTAFVKRRCKHLTGAGAAWPVRRRCVTWTMPYSSLAGSARWGSLLLLQEAFIQRWWRCLRWTVSGVLDLQDVVALQQQQM